VCRSASVVHSLYNGTIISAYQQYFNDIKLHHNDVIGQHALSLVEASESPDINLTRIYISMSRKCTITNQVLVLRVKLSHLASNSQQLLVLVTQSLYVCRPSKSTLRRRVTCICLLIYCKCHTHRQSGTRRQAQRENRTTPRHKTIQKTYTNYNTDHIAKHAIVLPSTNVDY